MEGFAYFVPVVSSEGNMPGILHRVTHQGVPAGKQQGLLDGGRIVADHIHYQLHIPRLTDLSVQKYIHMYMDLSVQKHLHMYMDLSVQKHIHMYMYFSRSKPPMFCLCGVR